MVITKLTAAVIICLLFIIGLAIIYFSKKRLNNEENKLYKMLLISNIVGLFFHLFADTVTYNLDTIPTWLSTFVLKTYLIYFFIFGSLMLSYLCIIANLKRKKIYQKALIYLNIIIYLNLYLLPQHVYRDMENNIFYTDGIDVKTIYVLSGIIAVLLFTIIIRKLNKIDKSKAIPLFVFMTGGIISIIIQNISPDIVIIDCIESIIILLMYFTIENPDLKILQELANNRRLTESNLEEKSNMLFQVSQEVKNPLMEITDLSSEINKSTDKEEIKQKSFKIENISRNAIGVINKLLDISQMDTQNIKFTNHTYDIYKVLKEVVYVTKNRYREEGKNIDFKYSISNTIPTALHGDPLKLKQIICSILFNAFANTDEGYIDLDITQMTKYNTCRLIITISDSGKGLSYNEINDLLNDSKELDEKELEKTEDLDMDLELTKKVIDLLGGSLLIKSGEDQGSTFTVILNQQIASANDEMKTLVDNLSNKKKVLLIDDDYLELDRFSYELKKNSLEVVSTMYGHDCIEKLANKEKFDLILVDDELDEYNALNILEDIKKLKLKNQKVVIMLEQQKEFMKNKFLNDYPFTDYLLKDDYKNEIVRIKDKYL